jgi:LCP family protein required for cell wall assembly
MWEVLNWSLMASGVTVLILVIRVILGNKIKKVWINTLWLIVLVRLLIPILPNSSMSLFNLWVRIDSTIHSINNQKSVVNTEIETIPLDVMDDEMALPNIEVINQEKAILQANNDLFNEMNKQPILLVLWFGGVILILAYFIIGYYQMKQKISLLEVVEDEETLALLAELKEMLRIKAEIKLVKGDYPFIFGLIRPVICMPPVYTRPDAEMILLHELMHFKYKDNVLTYLHIVAFAIHWFNPLVWMAIKLMKHDMELVCDERVLSIGTNKKQYANTLLKVALTPQKEVYWVQGMVEDTKQIKARLLLIATFKEPKVTVSILVISLLIIGSIVCLTNAQQPNLSTAGITEPLKEADQQEDNLSIEKVWKNKNLRNIAILGVDGSQLRTDTIMMVNLDTAQNTLKVISIPRDTKVQWAEEEKAAVDVSVPDVTKINEIYALAKGETTDQLAIKEIEKLLDIQIDDLLIIDFKTVEKVIDALGGLNIELMGDMRYTDNAANLHINLKKGYQQLDGSQTLQALRYRRYRDGDLGRIAVQQ